ncbi:MAG: hypothetical protein K1X28_00175 [Parachlamydiales bacterium]|nr:hypothetical protein [Parachlamydiales bacterium]
MFFFASLFASEYSWNGKLYNDETVAEMITVITTTNPIPSIPSTEHIYPSQKSLFRIPAFARCKKIIVFDGIQPGFENQMGDYEAYKRAVEFFTMVDPYFSNTELIFCEKWVHLAGAVKEAMARVTTPYVFIHQHDLLLVKDFDLNGLIATMEANENVKHVRLALPYANYHWRPWNPPAADEHIVGISFVPLCRHFQWSDNDHISTTAYYRDFVLPQCGHGPMEAYLDPALSRAREEIDTLCHPIFGTYLYGGMNDGGYLYHSDGRNK